MAPAERVVSDQTVVHHDSWSDESKAKVEEGEAADEVAVEDAEEHKSAEHHATDKEDHLDEEHHDEEPSENEKTRNARERQIDRIEAQIQAAARAVVASIEKDHYGGHKDSVLSTQTDESYDQGGSHITYDEGTELTYGDGTELTYDGTETSYEPHSEHEEEEAAGDSSSHHDGDIDDDDVFSRNSGHSARSSLNSVHDLSSADEVHGKELTSPTVGEEAIHSSPTPVEGSTISRIPSSASYTPCDATSVTPSKVLARPPFRTPSSVRAIQMSSPTPSIFSSPRSSKRHQPTVSRIGTPTSFTSPSKRTPTRFKVKKEYPLVLLHVTVLPLTWNYSHTISSPELPISLQLVKENWRLLQEKLGETVLERGILLSHPQDSYEILEERLLEALELPVRPRARILKCGHYMGPESPSSDEEGKAYFERGTKVEGDRRWCDICGRDVRLEGVDMAGREGKKRFRIKIYASNGLMTTGAWAACWREMERIDVEIEPFVEGGLVAELEEFTAIAMISKTVEEHEEQSDQFVDEEVHEDEHTREIENDAGHTEHEEQIQAQQEEEMARTLMEEAELHRRAQDEDDMRRKLQDEERMREIYGQETPPREESRPHLSRKPSSRPILEDDSLPDLLLKAFKVAMRDKKNVVICVLSIIVLLLALRPGSSSPQHSPVIMTDSAPIRDIVTDTRKESIRNPVEVVPETPKVVGDVVKEERRDAPVVNSNVTKEPAVIVQNTDAKETPVMEVEMNQTPIIDNSNKEAAEKHTSPSVPPSIPEPLDEPAASTERPHEIAVEEIV